MNGVAVAFAIIIVTISVGYLAARIGLIAVEQGSLLNRIAFYVFSPALLFSVLAKTSVKTLFSPVLLVLLLSGVVIAVLFVFTSRLLFRRTLRETAMGVGASMYLNSNNIGLPISLFVLGDLTYFAPVLVLHLVVLTPVLLVALELGSDDRASVARTLGRAFSNPLIVAALLGMLVAFTQTQLPDVVFEPLSALGAAAVPLLLFAYGVSLRGQHVFHAEGDRPFALTAIILKSAVMPTVAFMLSAWVFHLTAHQIFVAVVLAALPTAQNMFTYASVYNAKLYAVRDIVFTTTLVSLPVILLVTALLKA